MNDSLHETINRLKQFPTESKLKFKEILPELSKSTISDKLLKDIESMSEEEYSIFIDILKETTESGTSDTYSSIKYEDYEEVPVDIKTFICDPDYLGGSTQGGKLIYPFWVGILEKIFAPDSQIIEVVLTGAIGIGKSTVAIIGMAYILYKLQCLRNPAEYYNLIEGSKIAEAIFNIDLQHVHGIGYGRLQSTIKRSPWFIRHGILRGRNALQVTNRILNNEFVDQDTIDSLTYEPSKNISLLIGSKISHFTGYDVFCAFLDEMNFYEKGNKKSDSVETFTSLEVMKVYTAVKRRMESRFMIQGVVPGIIFMISSKRSENDALEVYAEKYKNDPTVLVVDEPQWVVKNSPGRYSGEQFRLLVGDKFNKTRILSDSEDYESLIVGGRKVIEVPVEHKKAFQLDADQALTDIAGIALVSGSKFFDAVKYRSSVSMSRSNIFLSDIVVSGLGTSDSLNQIVDLRRIPAEYKSSQVYIHLDTSKNHDRTGIGVIARTSEYKDVDRITDGDVVRVRDYSYAVLGSVGIEAPNGDMIPYRKLLEFIIFLRSSGLNITGISTDTYQSLYLQQELLQNGFLVTTISVDRTPAAYLSFRRTVYEGRLESIDNQKLEHELTELVENKQTGKIDHPIEGSKDLIDGVVGAYYNASITQAKVMSAQELASIQEQTFDAQLGTDPASEFSNSRVVIKSKDIFDEIDRMLDDDDDYY